MDSKLKRTLYRFVTSLLIVSFVFISCAGYLNGDTSTSENKLNKNYFKQFGRDVISVVSSPGHWKGKDLLILSAIVGTGALIFAYDQNVKAWMERYTLKFYKDISQSVTNLGDGVFLSGLMVSYYIVGEIFNRDNMRKIALLGMESFIISGTLVGLIKFSVGRARPYTGESKTSLHPFSSSSRNYSFPSGHAAAAFSVATVIAQHTRGFYIDSLVYGLAGLVALSRIHENKHWASDVFIGSVIGYFVGKKISDLNRENRTERLKLGFQLSPQRQALTLSYTF